MSTNEGTSEKPPVATSPPPDPTGSADVGGVVQSVTGGAGKPDAIADVTGVLKPIGESAPAANVTGVVRPTTKGAGKPGNASRR